MPWHLLLISPLVLNPCGEVYLLLRMLHGMICNTPALSYFVQPLCHILNKLFFFAPFCIFSSYHKDNVFVKLICVSWNIIFKLFVLNYDGENPLLLNTPAR